MNDKLVSVRLNSKQLNRIAKKLGVDESKAIRASLNLCDNVIHKLFGGEIGLIFRRKKDKEDEDFYESTLV